MTDVRAFLREAGADDAEIERAAEQGWLALLVIDRVLLPGRPRYDLPALAAAAGVDAGLARRLWRAVGFPDVPEGAAVFTDRDLHALRLAVGRIGQTGDVPTFLRQVRVIGAAMARLGAIDADIVASVLERLRDAGASDEEAAVAIAQGVDWPGLAELVDYVHRLQARAAVWRRLAREAYSDVGLAIGFADLAGYTELSGRLDPAELEVLLQRWEEIAYDCTAEHSGRVVKTIGDEVMFVGLAKTVVEVALAVRDTAAADPLVPAVRCGLASGQVIARDGDFFGPVVNLASRLAEVATPGQVLVGPALREQLASDPTLRWEPVPVVRLRGIGDVHACAVTRVRPVA